MSDKFREIEEGVSGIYKDFALELVAPWHCQLGCKNCYKVGSKQPDRGEMPAEFVRNVLKQAKDCGFSEAVFIGGEPTLHPQLPEFVAESLRLNLKPIVVTNGIKLANKEYAAAIGLKGSVLVLHAPLPNALQDEETLKPGYSDQLRMAYDNILRLKDITIVAEVVMIEEFLPHIKNMHQWCRDHSIKPFIEMNRRKDDGTSYASVASPEEVYKIFQELQRVDSQPPKLLTPPYYHEPCTMAITGVHVKNFGNGDYGGVYSCCGQGIKHGDLLEKSLTEILQDPSLAIYKNQDKWIYGPCRDCEFYSSCRGGCRSEAYLTFGCSRASTPSCWHIDPAIRNDPVLMIPPTCDGCPLQGNPSCNPRR